MGMSEDQLTKEAGKFQTALNAARSAGNWAKPKLGLAGSVGKKGLGRTLKSPTAWMAGGAIGTNELANNVSEAADRHEALRKMKNQQEANEKIPGASESMGPWQLAGTLVPPALAAGVLYQMFSNSEEEDEEQEAFE